MAIAILHTATRIALCVTTDANPTYDPTAQTLLTVPSNISLAGGPWVLDANANKTLATLAQVRAAGLDDAYAADQSKVALHNLFAAATTLAQDDTQNANVQVFAVAFRQWMVASFRGTTP